jgi:serine/threonine protein kinase
MNDTPREAPLRLPGFEQLEEIGRGGFGIVYRARQPALDRAVAIKVLVGALFDDRAQERFERERRSMGALSSHPAIVTIFESGLTDTGVPYIVMEFMEGGSLADRLVREGPMPVAEACLIGARVADALEMAHRSGVVHRDVKPDNILLSSFGEPKLTDFGIASLMDATGTKSSGITASIAHAPPEVLEGRRATARSDVYSLASTIFALIAGQPAFTRPTDEGMTPVIARILTESPPDLRPDVPSPVCEVLEQGLAKDPDARYASAADFAKALRAAAAAPLAVVDARDADGRPLFVPTDQTQVVMAAPGETPRRRNRALILGGIAAAVVAGVVATAAVAGGGGGGDKSGDRDDIAVAGITATSAEGAEGSKTPGGTRSDSTTTSSSSTTTTRSTAISGSPRVTSRTANSILSGATAPATAPASAPSEQPEATSRITRAPSVTPPPPAVTPEPTPPPPPPAEPTPPPPPPPPAGPATATVPNVVGLDVNAATAQLNAAGFTDVPTEYGCWGGNTNGVVFSQTPSGGVVTLTTPIALRMEDHDCEFVPNLIGLDQPTAAATLDFYLFPNYNWLYECYGSPSIGAVVSQSPQPGADVHIGTQVSFFLQANDCV